MKNRLSACLVIINEEKLLPRCLESIKGVVDEIIVVHDGKCKDKSLDIAKEFGAEVFEKEFIGEAEAHRPFSFEKASGDWILQIDADEFLSEKARIEIPKLIKSKKYDAYAFYWPFYDGENYYTKGPYSKRLKRCLFRKSRVCMIGVSHEEAKTYGKLQKRYDIHLEHKPTYDNFTYKNLFTKMRTWAKIQAKQAVDVENASLFNIKDRSKNESIKYYKKVRKHPFFYCFVYTIRENLWALYNGLLWSDLKSYKTFLITLIRNWMFFWYVARLKNRG